MPDQHYDVAILGAGLAGLCLARQLLLSSDKTVLLVDKRAEVPGRRQKVGESTVQLSGYYLSKVLDLEEHLLREHFLKYNLRFFYKREGADNARLEGYSQSFIRTTSNIAGYQLDRNKLEAEMLRLNQQHPNFRFCAPATDLKVSFSDGEGPHSLSLKSNDAAVAVTARWVVDATGRGKFLARRLGLAKPNPIRHGASFAWVDGLVNIEKLTDLAPRDVRLKKERTLIGHLPLWLATNHFVGEGFWFWVIPLQGKTSLGLVYDRALFAGDDVATPRKLIEWACREFPLFARDLPFREILDHGSFRDFSYDCALTISEDRWALSGESGRFSDPLYSPGGDLISIYNTLIADAILGEVDGDRRKLALKARLYETLMRAFYEAYVPSFAVSYDALGDQEAFILKYSWELAVYFSFYVFPFINDLFTDRRFLPSFLGRFARLGPINRNMQPFLSAYYQWKKTESRVLRERLLFDFYEIGPLKRAETLFYRVGLSAEEAVPVLDAQLANLEELARFMVAHVSSQVLDDESVLTNRRFVESINLQEFCFDPEEIRARYEACAGSAEQHHWSFDPCVLRRFRPEPRERLAAMVAESGDAACKTMRL